MDFEKMFDVRTKEIKYKPLPKFPSLTRDFSFVCDEELEVGAIEKVMSKAAGSLVESIKLFDIYRGAQLGENKKSVAFKISLRASDRTLNDQEADGAVKKILKALERDLGITLRA
jgi:phenylalanyl-tRNA synthetase beta chain